MPEENTNQLIALISLLDEPDSGVFSKVRDQIYSYGSQAVPMLESAWETTFDSFLQKRIEDIIHNIQTDQLYIDLTNWAHLGNQSLLDGYIHFTRFQFQNLDEDTIRGQISDIRRDIWLELNENLTALEKVKVLNHIIFEVHNFRLSPPNKAEIRYLLLNNLLDSRIGYSISIGVLYTIIAQSLDLPVAGILLPGERFIMAWLDSAKEIDGNPQRAIFYINPENRGSVFTRNEITALLKHLNHPIHADLYNPFSNKAIVDKLFALLAFLHRNVGNPERIDEINRLRSALE